MKVFIYGAYEEHLQSCSAILDLLSFNYLFSKFIKYIVYFLSLEFYLSLINLYNMFQAYDISHLKVLSVDFHWK